MPRPPAFEGLYERGQKHLMQGPAYLAVRQLGSYEFYWTKKVNLALRLLDREQADTPMMAVRQLRDDLFPACLTRCACATEHTWIKGH